MLQRGATLLHTLVILFAGMIAAGSVAAFASYAYRTAADQELQIKTQFALEGAAELAKYDVWSQSLTAGQTGSYTVDGVTVRVSLTDSNSVTPSTWTARAEATIEGRTISFSRTIGLATFPTSRINWVYNPNNQHHYALITVRAGMDFSTAKANAKSLTAPDGKPGYLATITSSAEWDWIRTRMLPAAGNRAVMVGAEQAAAGTEPNGGWAWSNSEPWSYTDWQSGEPNNGGSGEDLLLVNVGGVRKWFDAADVPGYTTFLVEAGDWVNWVRDPKTGRSYTYIAQSGLSWEEARTLAESIPGPNGEPTYLLSITSSHEQNFINNTLLPTFGSPNGGWLGGYQDPGSNEPSADWKWASGEPWRYTNWHPGEPNNSLSGGVDEDANHLYNNGRWNDIWRPNVWNVPGYWVEAGEPLKWQFNSSTGRWYAVVPTEGGETWTNANLWAQELSGPSGRQAYLTSITSAQEQTFINELVDKAAKVDGSALWMDWGWAKAGPYIGLRQTSLTTEPAGNWSWTTGEAASYSNWGPSQPDNTKNNEHFGLLVNRGSAWEWNDAPDNVQATGFVVEEGDPPYTWRQWEAARGGNNNFYARVPVAAGTTWAQAKALAESMVAPNGQKGYLVTITSAAEQSWVQSTFNTGSPMLGSAGGLTWSGAKQEPGSWEPKMGWVWDNGEDLISFWGNESSPGGGYWSGWHFLTPTRSPSESLTKISDGTGLDFGFLGLQSSSLTWQNQVGSTLFYNVIVEAGQPSQLMLLQSRWLCQWDGAANHHPDSARYPYPASDFSGALGPYEWPILSSGGARFTDRDPVTNEHLIYTPGNRGSNHQMFIEQEGKASFPLDPGNSELTGFFPTDGPGGRRQEHYKGTFFLPDSAAVNSVTMTMSNIDNHGYAFINGQYAFGGGQSLTNRSLLRVGDNRLDIFINNYGGPGSLGFNISVPVRPYAKPISIVHPNQFGLAIRDDLSAGDSPVLMIEGNAYHAGSSLPTGLSSKSTVAGFLYTQTAERVSDLTFDYHISGKDAGELKWPNYDEDEWHSFATTTYSDGTTITNPSFSTPGTAYSSRGTLRISGVYSGRGVIHADQVIITGHLRPATPDSQLSIIAADVRFGSGTNMTHYIDAVVFAELVEVMRPTVLTGSIAAGTLAMKDGRNSNLTIRQRELIWRSKALAKELRLPGYWEPNGLTGTYYRYTSMGDMTSGSIGTVPFTLGGRLNSNFRPYSSPIGRFWNAPTIQMTETTFPSRQLNWWTPTGTRVVQEKVQIDQMPFSFGSPFYPDGFTDGRNLRGVHWRGGFDMNSQGEINAATLTIPASDDMAAVYINGILALDHGGKHPLTTAGVSLVDRSMIRVGSNRIDVFYADLHMGGGFQLSSNITFYPSVPSVSSFTQSDHMYNWGLYIQGAFNMNQNFTMHGDAMIGSPWQRGGGTQIFNGMTWTSVSSRPANVTYNGHSTVSTSLLTRPSLPATSYYSSRANSTLTSSTLGPQTNTGTAPRLHYREGSLTVSGTGNWTGRHTIVVNGELNINGALNTADPNTKIVFIVYGNVTINGGGNTVRANILCQNQISISSATTLFGALWMQNFNQNAALTIWQDGFLYFSPEERTRHFLPGFLP